MSGLIAIVGACAKSGPEAYQGYVEGEFLHIGTGVGGRLQELSVERGQAVAAGAPLFRLDSVQEAAAVRQADEALSAAEAQLADLGTGKREIELEVSRAQLAQARASELQSAAQLERDTAQLEAGGISRMQLEASRAKHDVDLARVRELESQLEVAELSARPEQIRGQTSNVAAARATADVARWRLDQKHVTAERSGIVDDTLFSVGEWVAPGAPVVRLLPPENVKVRFFVPQAALTRFPIGQVVTIRCDGCATDIAAEVRYIATQPEYTPPIIYSNESRAKFVFMLEAHPVSLDGPALRPGQPVEVSLQ